MPGMRQVFFCFRKIQSYMRRVSSQRSPSELVEFCRSRIIEIATRSLGVTVSFPSHESAYVPAIFAEQCFGVVFRMALQENRETRSLLDEEVGTDLGRPRQNAIIFGSQLRLG